MRSLAHHLRSALRCTPRWCGLCLLGLIGLPAAAFAQRDRGAPVPDVTLLKRIAEAVDGHRTGELVYVVASLTGDHPVAGVFADLAAADGIVAKMGKDFSRFGPYQAPLDKSPPYLVGCVHIANTSRMFPERNQCVPPRRPVLVDDVRQLTLLVGRADGSVDTLPLPAGTDVVMLSLNAFDKFGVPYYLRTLGLPAVAELRAGFAKVYQTGTVPGR
jgi:hypothetical protein